MRVPRIGDVVHYVSKDLVHRPALVTETYINGQGLLIAVVAFKVDGMGFHQLIEYDTTGLLGDTWHWPEECA